jgi:alkylation response protein AidB-like acyl-CoA dehydrogenase
MQFSLTEEQLLIEASLQAFLAREYSFPQRARRIDAPDNSRSEVWKSFAALGYLGMPLPEACGGHGGGHVTTGLMMRAFGQHLVFEPFHACIVLAARLLAQCGRAEQGEQWLPSIIDGSARAALSHDEADAPHPWAARRTRAIATGTGWRLDGAKTLSIGAAGAGLLLVSASVQGAEQQALGQGVFLVRPGTPGLTMSPQRLSDGAHAADLRLDNVVLPGGAMLGAGGDLGPGLHRILAEALIALCWEASGVMRFATAQTAAHAQQRVQFGQPLARFQTVSHRLAEMAVHCEEARAACELAALRLERGDGDAMLLASMAKSKVGRGARLVAMDAVQLHGGMGISEELPIAACFRKLTAFTQQSGSTAWHTQHLGQMLLNGQTWRASQTLPLPDTSARDAFSERAVP